MSASFMSLPDDWSEGGVSNGSFTVGSRGEIIANAGGTKIYAAPLEEGEFVATKFADETITALRDALGYGNVVIKCGHCGQWGAKFTACKHCGAAVG